MNINKTILCGRIGTIGELRYFDNGSSVLSVSLATSEMWRQQGSAERVEHVEWHRLEFRNKDAENVSKYAIQGQELYVEGKARTRSYEDKEGEKQFVHFIEVDVFQFGSKPRSASGQDRDAGRDSGYGDEQDAGTIRPAANAGGGRASGPRSARSAGR